jgi:hypothetical protein
LTEGSKENALPDFEGVEQELKAIATETVARADAIFDKRLMVAWIRPILQKIATESTYKARRFRNRPGACHRIHSIARPWKL